MKAAMEDLQIIYFSAANKTERRSIMASFIDSVETSMDLHTLNGCKRHNRFQRYEFWESKSLTKLLDAIQKDYVPVGKDIRKFTMLKKKQDNEKSRSEKD